MAEGIVRTIKKLIKRPVVIKRTTDWISEIQSVKKKHNITFHHPAKMTPGQTLKKHEKTVSFELQDKGEKHVRKYNLGVLVRTADIKKTFSKGDERNWSKI